MFLDMIELYTENQKKSSRKTVWKILGTIAALVHEISLKKSAKKEEKKIFKT